MRRITYCFGLLLCAALLGGCTFGVVRLGPGGVGPGGLYADVNYPNVLEGNMLYKIQFSPADIELLEPVEASGHSTTILWLVSYGDSGYSDLMRQVRLKDGDGVMNVTIDTHYKNILYVWQRATTNLRGYAYRWKKTSGVRR